ncbi:hypothetical protein R5W24_003576 [Gemmata sp. JC717]|uniref:hypothetical protein n=1 Tax=Gemmata algarum TaxID=2975278 RepID=UPI0021BADC84|nr:hypothetical protein [Gemmata algarum]MDY3554452.1 hypothetical protein [Gemmata algarum]
MFKSVEYAGFQDRPDLKAGAERVVAALGAVVRDWDKQVALSFEARPYQPAGVEVTLTLDLPAARGSGSLLLTARELQDPAALESRCRAVWARATDDYLERRKPAWDEIINQPVEV